MNHGVCGHRGHGTQQAALQVVCPWKVLAGSLHPGPVNRGHNPASKVTVTVESQMWERERGL